MKKFFLLLLAAMLLTGCTAEPSAPTEPESTPPTEEFVIHYDALEMLEFDYEEVYAAAPMGDDLLLFSGADETTLIKISGRNHKELATYSANVPISPDGPAVQVSESGICYATAEEHIFLNGNLEEIERITLPDAWGAGVVSADQQAIYYSTGSALRVYNRATGLDRLLRETMHTGLVLEALGVSDSVLVCQLSDDRAAPPTLFYSAATGELLETYEDSISLASVGEMWLAKTSNGHRNQVIWGSSTDSWVLNDWESFSDVTLVDRGVLITIRTEDAAAIRFVDLMEGTEAAVALDEYVWITNAWNADGILWIALDDGRICRWELADTQMQEASSCFAPYYSRENPDTEGLAALEPAIRELENSYGVKIHIVEDTLTAQPEGMTLSCEYQVDALTSGLEELKLALHHFTPEFLAGVGKASGDGTVHICLVRAVRGDGCIQFWDEDGNARIALTVDGDLQRSFFHGLGHIIDSRVLTECGAFDTWKSLNPKDFRYSYDYTAQQESSEFSGAFSEPLAMTSPVEDRACTFACAMLEDTGSAFEGETMQRKLSTLCTGIRKAFGLKNTEDPLPWEQHLAE